MHFSKAVYFFNQSDFTETFSFPITLISIHFLLLKNHSFNLLIKLIKAILWLSYSTRTIINCSQLATLFLRNQAIFLEDCMLTSRPKT